MPDGSLRISTRIDNSKLNKGLQETKQQIDNQVKDLNRSYNNAGKDVNKLNLKVEETAEKYNIVQEKLSNVRSEIKKVIEQYKTMYSNPEGKLVIEPKSLQDLIKADIELKKLGESEEKLVNENNKIARSGSRYVQQLEQAKQKQHDINEQLEKTKQKQTEYNKKIEEAKRQQLDLNYNTEGISKSIKKGLISIIKYGATLLGIRSIYGFLSNAMNSWLNGNSKGAKQLKSDIDYMKNSIGRALSPILKYIVNLLYQALGFTGALIKVFTGIDIFAGSVADYMEATTSSANKTNKELKKQLTSFDRINKLEKNDTSNGSGSGGGIATPSQDLSNIMNKYLEQAEKLKQIFYDIKDYVIAIGLLIAGWKIADLLGLNGKQKLGLAIGLTSLYFYFDGISGLVKGELNAENFMKAFASAAGLGIATGMLTGNWKLGLIVAIGAISLIGGISIGQKILEYCPDSIDWYIDVVNLDWDHDSVIDKVWKSIVIVLGTIGDAIVKFWNESQDKMKESFWKDMENLSSWIVGGFINGLKENAILLMSLLYDYFINNFSEIILKVAKWIENIPIIGKSLANGIRSGVKLMEGDITKTVEDTTTDSIETAKIKINQKSNEAGEQAGTSWMSEMKNKINSEKQNLENTIKDTVTNASNNSNNTAQNQGEKIGNNYMQATKDSIQQSKESLENTIEQTTIDATNSSLSNAERSGNKLGIKEIDGIRLGETSQTHSLSSNLSGVVRDANNNVNTSSANGIGSNIISGIISGINGRQSSLSTTMSTVGSLLLNTLKNKLGIHSPSREMASLAKFIPLGIAEGIDSTSNKAIGSMKNLVYDLEDTMSDMDYSSIAEIPRISKNAISYVPKQAISTNEIQRTIVGQDTNLLNKLLSSIQSSAKENRTITIPFIIDGEEFTRKVIQLNEDYNLATNGGGL